MSINLLTWELGKNLGHVGRISSIAQALNQQGERVVLAARNLEGLDSIRSFDAIEFIPAPVQTSLPSHVFQQPATFAHILHNVCFGEYEEALTRVHQWRKIFGSVRPDVVVCDHSPTALLAARSVEVPSVCVGTGFTCPPAVSPYPAWRKLSVADMAKLVEDEQRVLQLVNRILVACGSDELAQLSDLYAEPTKTGLLTYPELDHFGPRKDAKYWGLPRPDKAEPPDWPGGRGRRVFAYLRPCPILPELCRALKQWQLTSIMYCPGLHRKSRAALGGEKLRLVDRPIDLTAAAAECDLFIGYGSHFSTTTMLLAGKPVLLLPSLAEQAILALRVSRLGMGRMASQKPNQASEALQAMLHDGRYRDRAEEFAQRHECEDRATILPRLAEYISSLA